MSLGIEECDDGHEERYDGNQSRIEQGENNTIGILIRYEPSNLVR